jgi:Fungal fucose-specific lectin
MNHNTFAVCPASCTVSKILAACMAFLAFAFPAYGDHIHHLWYNNSNWQDVDLTSLTGGPNSTAFGAIAAFRTTPNNQLHVYYVDNSASHLHQLYKGKSWTDNDLTALTGGPRAYAYGISGFAIGNLQYVFYVGADNHVHETYYNNSSWQDQDLTATVGGNTASAAPLLAFATKPNNQFHVYYQDANSLHGYQLFFNGTSWTYQDLTAGISGNPYCYTSWIAGFAVGNLQHLFCAGYDDVFNQLTLFHIHYNNSTWVHEVVTSAGLPMQLGAGIAAFKVPDANQLEVWSITSNNHFDRFYHVVKPSQWIFNDLTNEIGAPTDGKFGQVAAFVTTPNGQYHVYYAPNSKVYQVYYNGTSWAVEDLTNGLGNADPNSGLAGFNIGNLQHVFYMSND